MRIGGLGLATHQSLIAADLATEPARRGHGTDDVEQATGELGSKSRSSVLNQYPSAPANPDDTQRSAHNAPGVLHLRP